MAVRSRTKTRDERKPRAERPPPPPLDAAALDDMALRYVGKYATTASKLQRYLGRKLWERGWAGPGEVPVAAVVARCVERGYVDDRVFGEAKARGLASKGFGRMRVGQALGAAGLERDLAREISDTIDNASAAEALARRRRFGPYDRLPFDIDRHRKQVGAMLRAGHDMATVRSVLKREPEED